MKYINPKNADLASKGVKCTRPMGVLKSVVSNEIIVRDLWEIGSSVSCPGSVLYIGGAEWTLMNVVEIDVMPFVTETVMEGN